MQQQQQQEERENSETQQLSVNFWGVFSELGLLLDPSFLKLHVLLRWLELQLGLQLASWDGAGFGA